MKSRILLPVLLLLMTAKTVYPQQSITDPVPAFITPDTVCVGQEVNIINIISGSSFSWNFCTGNAGYPPLGMSIPSATGLLSDPRFVTLVKDSLECYSFVTCPGVPGLIRNYHGDSYYNSPVTTLVGNFSVLTNEIRGVQIEKDNGTWYGFVANGTTLVRMIFTSGLANLPTVIDINFPNITSPTGLEILKSGANWYGFCLDSQGSTLNRLDFGTTLATVPTVTNLGNIGQMNNPSGLAMRLENGEWYMLVCNEGNSTLTRIHFGNSLTTVPMGINLGNVGGLDNNTGITLTQDCGSLAGYIVNHSNTAVPLIQLGFDGGIAGTITGSPVGNPAGLDVPYGISQLLRVGDTIYGYATNTGNSTLSLLYFPVCAASSIPSYNGPTPPPFTYLAPGNYNIILTVDEGTATQTGSCNHIVVIPEPTVDLGTDRIICNGSSAMLDAGTGFATYQWNNGATTQTISTDTAGTFSVHATNRFGCEAWDTVKVTVTTSVTVSTDTSICFGLSYYCGGQFQNTSGTYYDSLQTTTGCDSVVITNLVVKDSMFVDLGPDTVLCQGEMILLDATTPGATYTWQDGSTDSVYTVAGTGTFWVQVTREGCSVSDSVTVAPCPVKIWFPNAFTPDHDGVNDVFRPRGISIGKFRMTIYDRWGAMVFETDDMEEGWNGIRNGSLMEADTYSFVAYYSSLDNPDKTYKITGAVTLVR